MSSKKVVRDWRRGSPGSAGTTIRRAFWTDVEAIHTLPQMPLRAVYVRQPTRFTAPRECPGVGLGAPSQAKDLTRE